MILELYGSNLAPDPICREAKAPDLRQICGVRVLVGTSLAELMYVSSKQINFKIPPDAPADGLAPLRVCVGTECSAPVLLQFSTRTAMLSLEGAAHVHMPIWIHVDPPPPYFITYPCINQPLLTPGYQFEVRRNGRSVDRITQPALPPDNTSPIAGCLWSSRGSLPLHLSYRFDEPGDYAVRLIAKKGTEIVYQSDWTGITIEPFSEEQRDAWLRLQEATALSNAAGVEDFVASLLALPDEKVLEILLKLIPARTNGCRNSDCVRLIFGTAALAWFDDATLRRKVPPKRLSELCPPNGYCK
jgi:hypothetical protein